MEDEKERRKPAEKRKETRFYVRVTKKRLEECRAAAEAREMTLSGWVHFAVSEQLARDKRRNR